MGGGITENKVLVCKTLPVEDFSDTCYNIAGANDVRDAAGKGAPICHITNDFDKVRIDSLSEDEKLFIQLLREMPAKPSIDELLIAAEEQ